MFVSYSKPINFVSPYTIRGLHTSGIICRFGYRNLSVFIGILNCSISRCKINMKYTSTNCWAIIIENRCRLHIRIAVSHINGIFKWLRATVLIFILPFLHKAAPQICEHFIECWSRLHHCSVQLRSSRYQSPPAWRRLGHISNTFIARPGMRSANGRASPRQERTHAVVVYSTHIVNAPRSARSAWAQHVHYM